MGGRGIGEVLVADSRAQRFLVVLLRIQEKSEGEKTLIIGRRINKLWSTKQPLK